MCLLCVSNAKHQTTLGIVVRFEARAKHRLPSDDQCGKSLHFQVLELPEFDLKNAQMDDAGAALLQVDLQHFLNAVLMGVEIAHHVT
jgi:hypothetical protein